VGTAIEFRNSDDGTIASFNSFGDFSCNFESRSSSGMDFTGVIDASTALYANQYRALRVIYITFTGYHRCYVDDEEMNNIEIFKNEYMGRIVISTGKIKTDVSIKKVGGDIDEYEWSSLCDKEGITVEDALPIIQLSRVRKDKRVYGVLGIKVE
jgi:hypothetical protein